MAGARAAARELIALEPFRESAHALLMELLAASGDVAEALRAYEALRTTLRDELGTVPAAHVRALSERLLRGGGTPPPPPPLPATETFVGRATEFAAATDALRAGRWVLVTGEPGIGKTSLAARAALAVGAGTVLYGRCDEEPPAPYQPFAEALRDLLARVGEPSIGAYRDELGRILGEPGTAGAGDRHRLFEAFAVLVDALDGPVLLVLDDLHWADASTLQMLRYLLRRTALLLLATSREPLGELVAGLRRERALERIQLAGLDVAATRELIATQRAAPDDGFVRRTHARTGGNPFFVEQIVRAGEAAAVPEDVQAVITQRVARLPSGETLRLAATIGAEFELALLEPLAGGRGPVLAALEAALAAGLVVERGAGRFAFVHALVREAIYEDMSATRRASLHQRIGEALEAHEPPPAAALAHHFLHARRLAGPERAVRWALAAADSAAAAYAWEDEVAQLESALSVLDESGSPDDATRCRLLLRLADRLVPLSGDFRSPCMRAAALARSHDWSDVLAEAAEGIARMSVDDEAIALLEEALAALGEDDSPWRARLLGRLADMLPRSGRPPERADALSREGLEIARRLDDRHALIYALDSRALALAGPDRLHERIGLLSEALSLAEDVPWRHNLRRERIVLRGELGDLRGARDDLDALAQDVATEKLEGTQREADVLRLRAADALIGGRLDEAERLADVGLTLRERLGDPDPEQPSLALAIPTRLAQQRGAELIDAVTARMADGAPWRAARSLLLASSGRREEALADLHALAAADCAAVPRLHEWLPTLTLLADACAELGDAAAADTLHRLLSPYADRIAAMFFGTAPLGPVALTLGRLAARVGQRDDALALLERALSIAQAIPAPLWVARARAELARA